MNRGNEMPTCPKCNKEIDHLHAFVVETVKYEIYLEERLFPGSGHKGLNWGRPQPTEGSAVDTEFCCPECGEALYSDVRATLVPMTAELPDSLAIQALVQAFLKSG